MVVELKHGTSRFMGHYMNDELTTLAHLSYEGYIKDDYKDPDKKLQQRTLASLERFKLANHCSIFIDGKYSGWAWEITEEGKKLLKQLRPMHYGCRCEFSIKMPCVCAESTYCPNPEHKGNGCNGTHD